jgi:uncharacterized coiled-coil DUF342 family protein
MTNKKQWRRFFTDKYVSKIWEKRDSNSPLVSDTELIELAALKEAQAEIERLKAERDDLNENLHNAREARSKDIVNDIIWLIEERDEARAEIERLKKLTIQVIGCIDRTYFFIKCMQGGGE